MRGVPVGADDREDLPLADGLKHRPGVGAGIDDDDFLVIADNPGGRAAYCDAVDPRLHLLPFL